MNAAKIISISHAWRKLQFYLCTMSDWPWNSDFRIKKRLRILRDLVRHDWLYLFGNEGWFQCCTTFKLRADRAHATLRIRVSSVQDPLSLKLEFPLSEMVEPRSPDMEVPRSKSPYEQLPVSIQLHAVFLCSAVFIREPILHYSMNTLDLKWTMKTYLLILQLNNIAGIVARQSSKTG